MFQFGVSVWRMREILIAILLSSGMLLGSRTIKVVEFQNNFRLHENGIEPNDKPAQSTRQITLCLRAMPRFDRDYYIIHTKQFKITIDGSKNGYTLFRNPSSSSTTIEYWRYFSLCQPRVPGKWTSICFGVNFTQTTQLIRVIQDGEMCSERIYTGDFDLLYFPIGNSIETM